MDAEYTSASSSSKSSFDLPSTPKTHLVVILVATGWFGGSYLAAKNRIEKKRLAKLDAGNALHWRALIMALPSESSVIPRSTAIPSPSVTIPIYVFTDPARNTFLTKVCVVTSTNGVVSLAPSMGATRKI
ncbi:unnamed protein product [Penicillium crustosum]